MDLLKFSGTNDKLIEALDQRFDVLSKQRSGFDYEAKRNLAFYRGYQYLVNAGTSAQPTLKRALPDDEDPHSRVMITINKVGPQVDRLVAKMTKGNPVPECRPVSQDEKDVSGAQVGTRILASENQRLDMALKIIRLYYWVVPCSTAFLHMCWNDKDGPPVGKGSKDQPLFKGNVDVNIVPHFQIVMNPDAPDMHGARWCIHELAMTADEIYEEWGVEVPSDAPRLNTLTDEMSMLGMTSRTTSDTDTEKFSVRRLWLPKGKSRSCKDGMKFVWCGEKALEDRIDFPYDHNHLPFAQFNFLPPQESAWGTTSITRTIEMQKDYNHARSREADIMDRLVPFLVAAQNQVDPDLFGDLVQILTYRGAAPPPSYVTPPDGWQNMWERTMDRADHEFGEATGITEAAKGGLAGTSPGVTVLAQQEAAAEPLHVPAKELTKGLSEYGWQHLMLVKQYWDEKRLVRTWSEAGKLEVERFSRADLSSQLDVHVSPESALPRSKAGRAELAIQLWQNGLVTDPRVFVRMLELPSTDVLAKSFDEDVKHAERENDMLAHCELTSTKQPQIDPDTGQPVIDSLDGRPVMEDVPVFEGMPEVEDWHNQEVHVAVHNSYRKTDEFQKSSDVVKAAFEAHVNVHMEIMGSRQQAQQQQTMMAAGGPPGAGAAPGGPAQELGGLVPPNMDGSQRPPVPDITRLAMMGGRAGHPGRVPGVSPDDQAAAMGR